MNKKLLLIFLVIFFIAVFLRLFNITNIPPGANRDEASIGYTAYSLLKTGNDEYGRHLPISFQSFGDWKLPLYIYMVVPMVKLFGLSELAVRLPSALFGIFSVVLTFILAKKLFKNNLLALIAMFLTAISPWHLHLSRVESEANVAVFLILFSTILLLESFKEKRWFIIPSLAGFALTYYTYAGNYIFTTLLLPGIFLLYKNKLLSNKFFKIGIIVFFILLFFISYQTLFSANRTKLSGISIFSDPSILNTQIETPRTDHGNEIIAGSFLHNRYILGIERFSENFLKSYSPDFLFIKGGENKAHNISNFGNMYLIEAPFLILGIIMLFIYRKKTESRLMLLWFLIAPIAASITKDAPHTNRMFSIFPALPIVVSLGLFEALRYFNNLGRLRKFFLFVIFVVYMVNITIYLDRYYVHFPKNEAQNWGLSYKILLNKINEGKYKNRRVVIAEPETSPYIFLLFYSSYDPQRYQSSVVRYPPTNDKFIHVKKYDRFEFRDIAWSEDIKSVRKSILIDFSRDIPPFVKDEHFTITEIKLPNKKTYFTLVESR